MLRRWLKDIHWPVAFALTGLAAMGILFIYSASYHDAGSYESKHLFWMLFGFLTFFTIPLVGYRTFLSVSYLLYVICIALLVWVLVLGEARLGAQRWVTLGAISIQPSEFAKLATVLSLANFLGSHPRWEKEKRTMIAAVFMAVLPFMLIVKQPDLGSSILFLPMLLVMLFLWGIRFRYLLTTATIGLLSAPVLWNLLKEYQKKRILIFLDANRDPLGAGYTAIQSRIAVGSGGLFGKGYLAGTQSQLQFVPEHHTDFIFCVIGEEWGFMGAMILLVLYGILFQACFRVIESTTDVKAKLLVTGIAGMLVAQVFINVGMTIGLMPITGVTLPLVSYGGSSFLATAMALGLILSIYKERSIF